MTSRDPAFGEVRLRGRRAPGPEAPPPSARAGEATPLPLRPRPFSFAVPPREAAQAQRSEPLGELCKPKPGLWAKLFGQGGGMGNQQSRQSALAKGSSVG